MDRLLFLLILVLLIFTSYSTAATQENIKYPPEEEQPTHRTPRPVRPDEPWFHKCRFISSQANCLKQGCDCMWCGSEEENIYECGSMISGRQLYAQSIDEHGIARTTHCLWNHTTCTPLWEEQDKKTFETQNKRRACFRAMMLEFYVGLVWAMGAFMAFVYLLVYPVPRPGISVNQLGVCQRFIINYWCDVDWNTKKIRSLRAANLPNIANYFYTRYSRDIILAPLVLLVSAIYMGIRAMKICEWI